MPHKRPKDDSPEEAAATGRLESPLPSGDTTRIDTDPAAAAESTDPTPQVVRTASAWRDFSAALRTAFVRGGWPTISASACVAFLAVLCIAVVLVSAIKLQYPGFGAGADPISILSTIVILGLASLGADVRIDRLELSAIPLGALLACGAAIAWAAAAAVRRRDADTRSARAIEGAKIAVPFAIVCLIASLAFTISGQHRVAVEPGSALVMAALWGAIFGAIGGMRSSESRRDLGRAAVGWLKAKGTTWHAGASGGVAALIAAAVLAITAGLVWVVVALASGAPAGRFDAGDAVAAIIYLTAFGPNVATAIVAVSLGAPIEIGARVSAGGELVGPLRDLSLFDWPGRTPWFAFLLVGIPLLAGLAGGFFARRAAQKAQPLAAVTATAGIFAAGIFLLALAAEARLGAGLVESRGFGRVAPNPWISGGLAFVWCWVTAAAGWRLLDAGSPSEKSSE